MSCGRGLWIACLLIAAGAAATAAGPAPGPGGDSTRTRYTFRFEDLERARHRLIVDAPGLRLLYVEELLGLESLDRRLGIAVPFGLAGPLALQGLLRKLPDPLGHGPASAAHVETTTLRLDSSFDAAARRGLAVLVGSSSLPGVRGGLAALEAASVPFQGAGWLGWEVPGLGRLEALAAYSLPPVPSEEEAWLLAAAPYPGGGLLHLAADVRLEREGTVLDLSGGASGGRVVPPGMFGDLLLQLRGPAVGVALLAGLCTPEYRAPDGEPAGRTLRAGALLELGGRGTRAPWSWGLEGELGMASSPPPGFLQDARDVKLSELRLAGAIRIDRSVVPGACRSVRLEAEGRRLCLADGTVEERGSVILSARSETGQGSVEAELGWRRGSEGEDEIVLRLYRAGARRSGRGSLCLRGALRLSPGPSGTSAGRALSAALRGDLSTRNGSLFCDLHTRRDLYLGPGSGSSAAVAGAGLADCLGITLGWDVRAPASTP